MAKVLVYPEKKYEEFGAKRWHISWEELKPSARGKVEIDFDRDITYMFASYPSEDRARTAARQVLDKGLPFFGAVTMTEQVVDWFVEEDRVAEWRDCGRGEEIS